MYNDPRWQARRWIGLGFLLVFAVAVAAMIYFLFVVFPGNAPLGTYPFYPFPFGWLWIFFGFFLFFGLLRWAFFPWHWGGYYRRYGYGYGYGRGEAAYHILRERYARGEITKDQYDAMMRDLYQQQAPPRP
jgi:putative membrane protein